MDSKEWDLTDSSHQTPGPHGVVTDPELCPLSTVLKRHTKAVLEHVNFNVTQAAKILGVSRYTVSRYIKKFNLDTGSTPVAEAPALTEST